MIGGRAMRVRKLVMLRHGQTDFNLGSRMQGQLDTELSDLGRAQAVAAAEALGKLRPLLIVSSDLRRAYDTAVKLGERTGLHVRGGRPVARDAPRRLAGHDARADRRRSPRRPAGLARGRHVGPARRREPASTWPRAACRWSPNWSSGDPEWGDPDHPDRPVVLVAHGGLIAALSAALLRSAGRQLAGAGRHGQRQLGAAVRAFRRRSTRPTWTASGGASMCGTLRLR